MTLPPGPGRVDVVIELDGVDLAPWEPAGEASNAPAVHELRAALGHAGRSRADRRRTRFGLRTAWIVTDDAGHARHLEVNGRPVVVKAVNYIPWEHFAEVGRSFYDRDMRMLRDAHGNSVGVHAHAQSPLCYDAADDAGVLAFQDFTFSGATTRVRRPTRGSSTRPVARSRRWPTCCTTTRASSITPATTSPPACSTRAGATTGPRPTGARPTSTPTST